MFEATIGEMLCGLKYTLWRALSFDFQNLSVPLSVDEMICVYYYMQRERLCISLCLNMESFAQQVRQLSGIYGIRWGRLHDFQCASSIGMLYPLRADRYIELKVILATAGVDITELDKIKE